MMKIERFVTAITAYRYADPIVFNYMLGVIVGTMYAICDYPNGGLSQFTITKDGRNGSTIGCRFVTNCTLEEYKLFKDVIEKLYPGECTFDPTIEK